MSKPKNHQAFFTHLPIEEPSRYINYISHELFRQGEHATLSFLAQGKKVCKGPARARVEFPPFGLRAYRLNQRTTRAAKVERGGAETEGGKGGGSVNHQLGKTRLDQAESGSVHKCCWARKPITPPSQVTAWLRSSLVRRHSH